MVSRNYVKDMDFFRPRTDFDYPYPMAFGLYEYTVAAVGKIFGFTDLTGRLTSAVIFLIGFIYFYKFVLRFTDYSTALIASAFYGFLPVSVFYSRAFQTDSSMVSFTIIFLYYFTLWVDNGNIINFILSVLFANLSFLFKIPSLFILIPATLYLYTCQKFNILKNPYWYTLIILSVSFPLFYQLRVPVVTDGKIVSAFFEQDKWANMQTLLSLKFWYEKFFANQFEFQYMHTGYIFLVLGLYQNLKKENFRLFYFWLLGVFLFFITAAKGMFHEYYHLPLVPVACIFIGSFLSNFFKNYDRKYIKLIKDKLKFGLICFMIFYCFTFSMIRLNQRLQTEKNIQYLEVANIVKNSTLPDEKIISISLSEPEILYYSERRGIHFSINKQRDELLAAIDKAINLLKENYTTIAIADFYVRRELPAIFAKWKANSIILESEKGLVIRLNTKRVQITEPLCNKGTVE